MHLLIHMRLLCSKSKGLFRLLAKDVEEAGHVAFGKMVLAGKVVGGKAIEQHLVELLCQTA